VLPQEAGLIQLEQSGVLSQNQSGEFLIHRQIRFPAELSGAHGVKFLLLRGVPKPEGDPGHSCVIDEATRVGTTNNPMCRRRPKIASGSYATLNMGCIRLQQRRRGQLWLSKSTVQDEREPDAGFA
jgi:hypothetical protein